MRLATLAGRTAGLLTLLLTGGCLLALVLAPLLGGWVPLTVLSGSMEPTIPTGSQVVVERVQGEADAEQLQLGDVVTFMPYPQDPTLVTHRIVGRTVSTSGVTFTTRGDANGTDDPWQVTARQLRGKVLYHVPYAGHLAGLLEAEHKELGRQIAGGGLLAYPVLIGVRALVRHARARRHGASRPAASR